MATTSCSPAAAAANAPAQPPAARRRSPWCRATALITVPSRQTKRKCAGTYPRLVVLPDGVRALSQAGGRTRRPALATPNLYPPPGLATSPGVCPIIARRKPGTDGTEQRDGHERARGDHCRRRSDRPHAGRRAGAGGGRRRRRRTTRRPGAHRCAGGRPALAHDRGARPARRRRPVHVEGADRPGARPSPGRSLGHQRLPDSVIPTRSGCGRTTSSAILADWVDELEVPILRGREVTGFAQDEDGVDVETVGRQDAAGAVPRRLRRRSQPRPQGRRHRLPRMGPVDQRADRRGRDGRGAGAGHPHRDARGVHAFGRLEYEIRDGEIVYTDSGPLRIMVTEAQPGGPRANPPCATSARRLVAVYGTDYGVHSPTWISRFTDTTRQAETYRDRSGAAGRRRRPRALTGGRAGPQHRGAGRREPGLEARPGGQGDLADEPARHLPRRAPSGRRARAAHTMAQVATLRTDDRTRGAARHRRRADGAWRSRASGSPGCCPAWTSTTTSARDTRCWDGACPTSTSSLPTARCGCSTLLHDARPVLLNLGEPGGLDIAPWADRVPARRRHLRRPVGAAGPRRRRPRPPRSLIRPDGYVGWVGGLAEPGLTDALTVWFGAPLGP